MVEADQLDETCDLFRQPVEAIDVPPHPGGPAVARLVVGVDREAPLREVHRHLVVTAGVLAVAVDVHNHLLHFRRLRPMRHLTNIIKWTIKWCGF